MLYIGVADSPSRRTGDLFSLRDYPLGFRRSNRDPKITWRYRSISARYRLPERRIVGDIKIISGAEPPPGTDTRPGWRSRGSRALNRTPPAPVTARSMPVSPGSALDSSRLAVRLVIGLCLASVGRRRFGCSPPKAAPATVAVQSTSTAISYRTICHVLFGQQSFVR
jgi:hypothetical protein